MPLLMDLALDQEAGQAAVGGGAVPTRTRAFAVYGMGLLGEASTEVDVQRRIVRTLISILENDDEARADVPVAAALSLGVVSLPWSTPEEPVGLWRDRASVLRYLHGRMEPEAAREAAFGRREVRAQVPLTMARLLTFPGDANKAGTRAADRLHSVISDQLLTMLDGKKGEPDESVRQSAIIGLGVITPAGASPSERDRRSRQVFLGLRRVSEKAKAPHSRGLALMALATMGSRPGRDREPLGLAREIQEVLVDAVKHGKGHRATWAGLALGILADGLQARGQALEADSLAALRKAFDESRRQHEVGAYGIALGLAGDRQAEARLTENLRRFQSDGVRGEMALALGLLGAAGSQAEIDRILTQSKFRPALLREVAVTLGIMGDKKVVSRLVDMLRQSRVQSAQAAVAGALGRIGDASAIAPLLVMAKDSGVTDGARAFAVAALGTTCDRRNFGFSARFRRHANYRVAVDTLNDPRRNGFLDIL